MFSREGGWSRYHPASLLLLGQGFSGWSEERSLRARAFHERFILLVRNREFFTSGILLYENTNYFNLASILRWLKKYRDKRIFIFLWTEQIECHDSFKIADPFTDFQLAWNRIAFLSLSLSLQNKIRRKPVYEYSAQKRLKMVLLSSIQCWMLTVIVFFFFSFKLWYFFSPHAFLSLIKCSFEAVKKVLAISISNRSVICGWDHHVYTAVKYKTPTIKIHILYLRYFIYLICIQDRNLVPSRTCIINKAL